MLSIPEPRPVIPGVGFPCTVSHERDAAIVTPHGELDIATVPVLDTELRRLRDAGCERLVVDLRGLTFIDSSGIHLLLRWAQDAARRGISFSLVPGSQRVQMVLAMTGVLELFAFDRQ